MAQGELLGFEKAERAAWWEKERKECWGKEGKYMHERKPKGRKRTTIKNKRKKSRKKGSKKAKSQESKKKASKREEQERMHATKQERKKGRKKERNRETTRTQERKRGVQILQIDRWKLCQMRVYIKKPSYFQRFQVCLDFRLILGWDGGGNPGRCNFHHLFQPFGLGGVTFHAVFNRFSTAFPRVFHDISISKFCSAKAVVSPGRCRSLWAARAPIGAFMQRWGERDGWWLWVIAGMLQHIIGIDYHMEVS